MIFRLEFVFGALDTERMEILAQTRERPLILRVPAPGGGVIAPPGIVVDMVTVSERLGLKRSA